MLGEDGAGSEKILITKQPPDTLCPGRLNWAEACRELSRPGRKGFRSPPRLAQRRPAGIYIARKVIQIERGLASHFSRNYYVRNTFAQHCSSRLLLKTWLSWAVKTLSAARIVIPENASCHVARLIRLWALFLTGMADKLPVGAAAVLANGLFFGALLLTALYEKERWETHHCCLRPAVVLCNT